MWFRRSSAGMLRPAIDGARGELERALVGDVAYWSGPDAERAPSAAAHLLPSFDELLVGYRDRSASLQPAHVDHVNAGGGIFNPIVVLGGRVRGIT